MTHNFLLVCEVTIGKSWIIFLGNIQTFIKPFSSMTVCPIKSISWNSTAFSSFALEIELPFSPPKSIIGLVINNCRQFLMGLLLMRDKVSSKDSVPRCDILCPWPRMPLGGVFEDFIFWWEHGLGGQTVWVLKFTISWLLSYLIFMYLGYFISQITAVIIQYCLESFWELNELITYKALKIVLPQPSI